MSRRVRPPPAEVHSFCFFRAGYDKYSFQIYIIMKISKF